MIFSEPIKEKHTVERSDILIFNNVQQLAKKKKITLSELEKRAGLGKGAISKWKHINPNVSSLMAVADVLGVTLNTLVKE